MGRDDRNANVKNEVDEMEPRRRYVYEAPRIESVHEWAVSEAVVEQLSKAALAEGSCSCSCTCSCLCQCSCQCSGMPAEEMLKLTEISPK
jgi:hypothetical protein